MINIISLVPTAQEKKLIACCAHKTFGPDCDLDLSVRPLGRYGFTGARLFLCHQDDSVQPFVVKIHARKDIDVELSATKHAGVYFRTPLATPDPCREGRLGALMYQHVGGSLKDIGKMRQLNEVVYNFDDYSDQDLCGIFRSVYDVKLEVKAPTLAKYDPIVLGEAYDRYRRLVEARSSGPNPPKKRIDSSKPIIRGILGSKDLQQRSKLMEKKIVNPTWFLYNKLLHKKINAPHLGPIHGDLHPNNVMIDRHGGPSVIDFAWADFPRHRFIDYALMECSLRFLLFPSYVNLTEHQEINERLLNLDGPDSIRKIAAKSHLKHHYIRLARILEVLRERVRKTLGDDSKESFAEYLASQFMILYGLLRFDGYSTPAVVCALGMIARQLQEIWF